MEPEFRTRKTKKGWIVEYRTWERSFFGQDWSKWKPFITWSGMTEAFAFRKKESAANDALMKISRQLNSN